MSNILLLIVMSHYRIHLRDSINNAVDMKINQNFSYRYQTKYIVLTCVTNLMYLTQQLPMVPFSSQWSYLDNLVVWYYKLQVNTYQIEYSQTFIKYHLGWETTLPLRPLFTSSIKVSLYYSIKCHLDIKTTEGSALVSQSRHPGIKTTLL